MNDRKLKLWVWHEVLNEWSPGIAFALAETPEQAAELIRSDPTNSVEPDGTRIDGVEPVAYDSPVGFVCYGSS